MSFLLFAAAEGEESSGPSGLVVLAILVVAIVVLRWLHSIGFYGKAIRALTRTLVAGVIVVAATVALAAGLGKTNDLEPFVDRNSDMLLLVAGLWLLAGLFFNYQTMPSRSASDKGAKPVAAARPAPAAVAGAGAALCPSCRGSCQTERDCISCGGMGETRCEYKDSSWWWGQEVVKWWCVGGTLTDNSKATNGKCPSCNGRGFHRCVGCRGRGTAPGTCSNCGGKGTV